MDKRVYPLATKVIELAGTERPADAVLRLVIRDAGHVGKQTAGELSEMVFGYYRWRAFLTTNSSRSWKATAISAGG